VLSLLASRRFLRRGAEAVAGEPLEDAEEALDADAAAVFGTTGRE
jgi:hypothetical protein